MSFLEKLEIIRNRQGMYFPTGKLIEATSFVAGMDIMQEKMIGNSFREWLLSEKLKTESPFYWQKLVDLYMENNNIAIDYQIGRFFELLFEYLKEKGSN